MPVNLLPKKQRYVEVTIQGVEQILNGYYNLRRLQDSNSDLSFVDGGKNSLVDGDFTGTIDHLDLATFVTGLKNGLFPIIDAIEGNSFSVRTALQTLLRT